MSSSLSGNGGGEPRRSSPPSAPSAKISRELGGEPQAYRPPALRNGALAAVGDEALGDQTSAYGAGYRRARAGTLPSNLSSFAPPPPTQATPGSALVGNAQPASGLAMNPALRQVLDASGSPGRARSGSLTLPSPGLSNAFGQPIFASSGYGRQVAPGSRPPMMEGMSRGYSNDSIENEAMSNGVLDYLGLAESPSPSYAPVPATLSELKAQAQQQIQNSRSRASTVSSPYRQTRATLSTSLLSDALAGDDGHEYGAYNGPAPGAYPALSQTPPNAFKKATHLMPSSRPRATSVGTLLDSPSARNKASSAYTSAHEVDAVAQKMSQQLHLSAGPGQYPGQQQQQLLPGTLQRPPLDQHRSDTNVSAAYLQQQGHALHARTGSLSTANTPRAHTPDTGAIATAPVTQGPPQLPPLATSSAQVPTRSLWLGNLDAAVTTQELMRVFHVYGAIESLRLLPDKECGFVNFVEKADAIRAMDDVRHRLGGRISTLGEGKPVRVGYGKVDSVPLGPGSVTSPTEPGPGGITNEVQAAPTRALWIGSIPANTTPAKLLSIFSPFGPIESVRVLTHKNCGFINFERIDSAVVARKTLNGRDVLGAEVGGVRIGFARVPVKSGSPDNSNAAGGIGGMSVADSINALRQIKGASDVFPDTQVLGGNVDDYRSNLVLNMVQAGELDGVSRDAAQKDPVAWAATVTEQQLIMRIIGGGDPSAEADVLALAEFPQPATYYSTIPQVPDRAGQPRRYDVSSLRETKKRLEMAAGQGSAVFDEIAVDLLDDCVDLASDHIGNTVIQKLYENCSLQARLLLLERIAPYLAMIGVHKNGTWAAQKIIDCATTPEEVAIIAQNLRPFVPPLLLDQYGNYVVSVCLRFGPTTTDFIFDAIIARLWDVAQGRYGARSIRTCLDSPSTSASQRRKVAVNIILNSIPLATSPNGALLVTWLLESSQLPGRYSLLASRFEPHLAHLCSHKLASASVLRIINQHESPEATTRILRGLFLSPNDETLTEVLRDQIHGVSVVQKILALAATETDRPAYVEATTRVLSKLNVSTSQMYRRILEEVGLPFVPPPPPAVSSYNANTAYSNRQQFAPPPPPQLSAPSSLPPQVPYPPYGAGVSMYDSSLMMGMNTIATADGWAASPMASHLQPLLVGGAHMDQFRTNTLSPTFSPTSDPFNPFASPPRQERGLPGSGNGFRRSSGRTDRSASGRSTPQQQRQQHPQAFQQDGSYGGPSQAQLDWQRRQGQQFPIVP